MEFSQPSRAILASGLGCSSRDRAQHHEWDELCLTESAQTAVKYPANYICEIPCKLQRARETHHWSQRQTNLRSEHCRSNGFFSPSDFCLRSFTMNTFSGSISILPHSIWKKYVHTYRLHVKQLSIHPHSLFFYLNNVQWLFNSLERVSHLQLHNDPAV